MSTTRIWHQLLKIGHVKVDIERLSRQELMNLLAEDLVVESLTFWWKLCEQKRIQIREMGMVQHKQYLVKVGYREEWLRNQPCVILREIVAKAMLTEEEQDDERRRREEKREQEENEEKRKREQEEKEENRRLDEKETRESDESCLRTEVEQLQQQFAMVMEQQKKDREDSWRRIMEIANTSQEMLKQDLESRKHDKIEAEKKAEEQATAVALELEKEKEAKEAPEKKNKKLRIERRSKKARSLSN